MSSSNGSYANEKPPSTGEPEYANDPASGSFFSSDYKRHEDLKAMLDGNKDGLKLEAMKRIIGMVAKGKDASDLFPAVVKNVVSKNIEVKKLVYVYLVRYAEDQQDLALLSISTFQRALKDPNQLIRASALRVLSSIRVPVIIPIVMLAVKDAVSDMSPYVRKTVAHAIPKLYSLDPEQKDQLIEVIEKLLSDKTTLVVGSVVMAFEEVCPERIDLVHKNYRKLCNLLVDVEEWGQVVIVKMLTRYARTQFVDPNRNDLGVEAEDKPFYEEEDTTKSDANKPIVFAVDPDLRLLLRVAKPLLQSRNTAVVMSVAQLYHHLAPRSEVTIVAKALIRLLHNHREVQSIVLSNIATMSTCRKGMFEPYLKSFFIRSSDPTHIKLLKLEILTNLATETSISVVLREFQTYVSSADKEFVASTIQAIGRCASNIPEVTDTCLNGLVNLMSNRSEAVVAESVVVIKKLLQMQPSQHKDIIIRMIKVLDKITVPMARASILWLLGEYSDHVPKYAPDVLRILAKSFTHEEDIVKLQVLSLATKLFLTNPKPIKLLCQYVFNLAKYDQNYDIRDRARFLKQLVFSNGEHENILFKHCKKIFLATKPAPLLESKFKDRDHYQLGSLSHFINARANGYHDLPEFPSVPPDPSVRNVEVPVVEVETKKKKQLIKKKSFYSETDSSSDDASSKSESSSDSESSGDSESENSSQSEESGKMSESDDEDNRKAKKFRTRKFSVGSSDENVKKRSTSSSESSESSSDESSSENESEEEKSKSESHSSDEEQTTKLTKSTPVNQKPNRRDYVDLLLDLNDIAAPTNPSSSVVGVNTILLPTPSAATPLSNDRVSPINSNTLKVVAPIFVPLKLQELVNKVVGNGISIAYRYTRNPNVYSLKMTSIELSFTNHNNEPISGIKVGKKKLASGMEMHEFADIELLPPLSTTSTTLGLNFNETTQPAEFEILAEDRILNVTIKAPVGELLQPINLSEHEFLGQQNKLKGLNENSVTCDVAGHIKDKGVATKIFEIANVYQVQNTLSNSDLLRFVGQSISTKAMVLLTVQMLDNSKATITINCEKIVISSMLLKEVKVALSK
ncbi:AP-3 complex subunit beta-2 [Chamberlinius hualienensis]